MSFNTTGAERQSLSGSTRISSLDGLRGLAASLVVVSHLDHFLAPEYVPQWVRSGLGGEAVAVFYALSGFLMAFLYGSRRFDAPDFMVHRLARIVPVYAVSVIFVTFLSAVPSLGYIEPIEGPVQIARHLVMAGSSGVFWSIPPETQFYFYFLLIWLWLENPTRYQWVPLLTGALVAVCAVSGFYGPGILLPSKLHFFLSGVIAGRLFAHERFRLRHPAAGFICLALMTFFFLYRGVVAPEPSSWGLASALCAAVIVYLAAVGDPVADSVLGSGALKQAGKISFSLYLLHVPVMFLTMKAIGSRLANPFAVAIAFCVAYGVAFISYLAIEKPSRLGLVTLWRRYKDRSTLVPQR